MKAILLVLICFAVTTTSTSFGQGTVIFRNNNVSRVYYVTETGSTTFIPVGSQFTVELMFAPDSTPADAFDSVAVRVGATTIFSISPGLFAGGIRTVTSITPPGAFGRFQVRVWETAAGSSYAATVATADPQWRAGKSAILRVDTGDPTALGGGIYSGTPDGDLPAYGLTSFIATPVPEPSTIALAFLVGGALLLSLRRNTKPPV